MAFVIGDTCIACGSCQSECPNEAIQEGDIFVITDACIECGVCMDTCPVGAITEE